MKRILNSILLAVILSLLYGEVAFANYKKAQTYFKARDYTRSAPAFFQSLSYPKDRAEKLKAEWGLAQSLQKMGFMYSASRYYSTIVRRGPQSSNPFFRKALEELGKIDETISLGRSHIVQLLKTRVSASKIPGPARGFYFYYKGVEEFSRKKYKQAKRSFKLVTSSSNYYLKALFHLGVIANLNGKKGRAISYFEKVSNRSPETKSGAWLRGQALLNLARVHYEAKRYRSALNYYREIPRESSNWLEAVFEGAWAFFLMQNHNNTLGNIHTLQSPFFEDRFFPESYVLQAITYLRLCRYSEVKRSLVGFKERYGPVMKGLRKILESYKGDDKGFFSLVYKYRTGRLKRFREAWAVLDALSRTDAYREAGLTIRFSDSEGARLSRAPRGWRASGLLDELKKFLSKKKKAAVAGVGGRLYSQGRKYYAYLKDLSNQTKLINAEMLLGKVDSLRSKISKDKPKKKAKFIGGMRSLDVAQDLEYWPFEGEYWEDELGNYVYNIGDKCRSSK